MTDEKSIELMEENKTLREALADLIYLCESSNKAIDCLSDEFLRIKKIAEN